MSLIEPVIGAAGFTPTTRWSSPGAPTGTSGVDSRHRGDVDAHSAAWAFVKPGRRFLPYLNFNGRGRATSPLEQDAHNAGGVTRLGGAVLIAAEDTFSRS